MTETSKSSFAGLALGDNCATFAEIMRIKTDSEVQPPRWKLYELHDGANALRAFGPTQDGFQEGNTVAVLINVRAGKPYRDVPQLLYKIIRMEKVDPTDARYPRAIQQLGYQAVLQKAELAPLSPGTRVKLFTKVLDLHPLNGTRAKNQKVVIADELGQKIALWLPIATFPLLESLEPEEFFLLYATVQAVPKNPSARFLAFTRLARGTLAFGDPLAQQYLHNRVQYHTTELMTLLTWWKKQVPKMEEDLYILELNLRGIQEDLAQEVPASSPHPLTES